MARYESGTLGPAPRDPVQAFWDPELQTLDRERLRLLQDERLRAMVTKVFEAPVPLFKRKLEESGITAPGDVTGVDDLARIPLTVKQDLRDAEAEHPPYGDYRFTSPRECVRLGTSTGTTGTPTIALWTRHDIWVEYESAARNWWRNGFRPGNVVTHAHPAYLYGGGVMMSGCLEYFGMLNLWVAPPDTDELAEQGIRTWQRIRPDLQMVTLSQHRFQEVAAGLGLDLREDCGFPDFAMGGFGRGLMPLMTAGFECYGFIGGADAACDGAHLHEDWAIVQAVDPDTGADVPDGQWGNLVVTTLDRDNGMLRYDLEEAAMLEPSTCPLGETSRVGFWGGRFKDLLSSQGVHFQVSDLEKAVGSVAGLATPTLEFVVVNPGGSPDPLRVRVEVGGDAGCPSDEARAGLAGQVRDAVLAALGIGTDVTVLDRGTLPRSGYKLKRVVDE